MSLTNAKCIMLSSCTTNGPLWKILKLLKKIAAGIHLLMPAAIHHEDMTSRPCPSTVFLADSATLSIFSLRNRGERYAIHQINITDLSFITSLEEFFMIVSAYFRFFLQTIVS